MILVCIDFRCTAIEHFRASPFFAINILTEAQRGLSVVFAAQPEAKFQGVDWTPGQTSAPLLDGTLAAIECRLERAVDAGDHALIFGEVVRTRVDGGRPLLYFDRDYRALR